MAKIFKSGECGASIMILGDFSGGAEEGVWLS